MTTAAEVLAQSRYGQRRRRRKVSTPEGGLLKTVLEGLERLRIPAWRIGVGSFLVERGGRQVLIKIGTPGLPDVVALVPGVGVVFIECKAPAGKLRPEQVTFRDSCRRAAAVHVVCRRWEDVEPYLRAPR